MLIEIAAESYYGYKSGRIWKHKVCVVGRQFLRTCNIFCIWKFH